MKHFCIFVVVFLATGICSLAAQDLIVLKNGEMIEAKVIEISPTEIRYKRFDNLDGPTIVIPASSVLSIKYENGTSEIINADSGTAQENAQAQQAQSTAMDTDKFIFGVNANAGGAIGYIFPGGSGASVNIELGKGKFNSEINLLFPASGFGALFTFNRFWPGRLGGFYLGGGIGYIFQKDRYYGYGSFWEGFGVVDTPVDPPPAPGPGGSITPFESYHEDGKGASWHSSHLLTTGLNVGYKFVLSSGLYFRTGVFIGAGLDFGYPDEMVTNLLEYDSPVRFYMKPDLAIGWTVR